MKKTQVEPIYDLASQVLNEYAKKYGTLSSAQFKFLYDQLVGFYFEGKSDAE